MAVWSTTSLSEVRRSFGRLDAEFFRPEYLANDRTLKRLPVTTLRDIANKIDVGHVGSMVKHYTDNGVTLIQTQNVCEFFLDMSHIVKVTDTFHRMLKKSTIRYGDILIARSGSFGSACVYMENVEINSADIIIVNIENDEVIEPLYLVAFMNCKFGSTQLVRFASGGVQGHVNLRILEHFQIPVVNENDQAKIAGAVESAYQLRKESEACYTQAQQLLESELGLDNLHFDAPVGYTARLSVIETERRTDAEFYHVKYDPSLSCVEVYRHGFRPLRTLSRHVCPNFDRHGNNGQLDYIEIGDIEVGDGSYAANRRAARDLPANAKIALSGGELLISQVRPTRGAIAIVDNELAHPTVCSGAFYVCVPEKAHMREVIWLYLRCMKDVFAKYCGGTSYPTIESRYIGKFPVPLFEDDFALKIRDLVMRSRNAKRESEGLLLKAKTRVEQLIEEAIEQ
jgi:type I restriction enzyme, S subunit